MDAAEQLQMLVNSLTEKELRKLAAKVELDRDTDMLGLPHNAIMQLLRPSLALIRAPRVHHAQRIFCMPFEDMLVNGKPDPKPLGKIDRSSIIPMWDWFMMDLTTPEFDMLCKDFVAAQREGDDAASLEAAKGLWRVGGEKITTALEGINKNDRMMRDMAKRFGGENRLNDIIEMAGCLRIAEAIEDTKLHLRPKPMMDIAELEIQAIKRGYTTIAEATPGDEIYFLLSITGRLLESASIFKVLKTLSRKGDDAMLQKTDMGIVGDVVIKELEDTASQINRASAKGNFNEEMMVEDIYVFANGFKLVTDNMGITRDGDWGQRMFKSRAQVSDAIDRKFLHDAEQRIMSALPTKSGGRVPRLTEWPNDNDFELAEQRAKAINDINQLSKQLGNQSACRNLTSRMLKHFDNYSEGMLKALPQAPEHLAPVAQAYVYVAVRLMELILGPEDADILRRRANVALGISAQPTAQHSY